MSREMEKGSCKLFETVINNLFKRNLVPNPNITWRTRMWLHEICKAVEEEMEKQKQEIVDIKKYLIELCDNVIDMEVINKRSEGNGN